MLFIFKVYNKEKHQNDVKDVVGMYLKLTLNAFHTMSLCFCLTVYQTRQKTAVPSFPVWK